MWCGSVLLEQSSAPQRLHSLVSPAICKFFAAAIPPVLAPADPDTPGRRLALQLQVIAIVEICSTQSPKVPLRHLLASFSRDEVEVNRQREREREMCIYIYNDLLVYTTIYIYMYIYVFTWLFIYARESRESTSALHPKNETGGLTNNSRQTVC